MRLAFFISFLAVISGSLCAVEPWTWEKSLERVRGANPEISAAQSTLKASEYSESGAYSNYFPQLTGALNYSYGTTSPSGGLAAQATSNYSASLSISQNLFSGFLDAGKVSQAKANREANQAALDAVRAKLSFDLKSAFASLVYAQKYIALTDDIIQRREANLKIVDLSFQSGRENRGSLLLSQAYLEQAKYDHLQAMDSLGVSQTQLARVLGIDEISTIAVAGTVPVNRPEPEPDLKSVAEQVPDYRQSIAQEKAADAGFEIARSGFFPILSVTGATTNGGPDFFPQSNRWTVGASLTFPFFSGGKDYYATKSAAESKTAAVLTKENTFRNSIAKLKQGYASFIEAVQKLQSDKVFSDAATVRAKIGREKYNNGLLTFEDWDLIENDLVARQKAYLQSERDRTIAEATWEQAQGKGALP